MSLKLLMKIVDFVVGELDLNLKMLIYGQVDAYKIKRRRKGFVGYEQPILFPALPNSSAWQIWFSLFIH